MKTHVARESARLLFSGLGLAGAVIITLCFFLYVRLTQTVTGEVDRYLYEVAYGMSSNMDARIESTFRTLESVGRTALDLKKSGQLERAFLQEKAAIYGYEHLAVMDSAGNTVTSDPNAESVRGHSYMLSGLNGEKQLTRLPGVSADGSEEIVFVKPILQNGTVVGAVSAWKHLEPLREAFRVPFFEGHGFSQIVDAHGNIILSAMRDDAPENIGNFHDLLTRRGKAREADLTAMRANMLKGKSGGLDFELDDGLAKTLRYVPMKEQGLYLLSIVPETVVTKKINALFYEAMVVTITIVALFLAVIAIVIRLYRNHNRELAKAAFVDPVTGGHTRTRFILEAEKKIRKAPPSTYAMLSLNIEKFKLLNDLFGIEVADRTLKYVYDALLSCMDEDELLSRDYADEFSLLVKYETKEKVLENIERFLRRINAFSEPREKRYSLRIALGVYRIDDPSLSIVDMQDRAALARKNDRAAIRGDLYRCGFYSDIDRSWLVKSKDIENRMESALANGDFKVYLQPKIGLSNDSLAGAEALVRWHDKERGVVPPGEFIPFFESNGFITKLDLYIFEQVCALIRKWLDNGVTPVPISVNMSRAHMREPDSIGKFVAIRDSYAIPHGLLEFELTESLEFDDMKALADLIDQLHSHGFPCSLDDFGSGYSSLNTLRNLKVDTLKLDGAFWSTTEEMNTKERDIIGSLVALAKKLNMTVVSEGVETLEQVAFLRTVHCDMVQGFVFSKPVTIEEFESFLDAPGSLVNSLGKSPKK